MGRKRHRIDEQDLLSKLVVYSKVIAPKADEQNTGTAFYGSSVEDVGRRTQLATAFYPFQLQAPPPADRVPAFQPEEYHVEVADPTLLATSIPDLLQSLLDASAPPPTVRQSSSVSRSAPPMKPAEEKALVEKLRRDGRTWSQVATAIGAKSASSLRKKYTREALQWGTPPTPQNPAGIPVANGAAPPTTRLPTPPPSSLQRAPSPVAKLLTPQKGDSGGSADSRTQMTVACTHRDPRLAAAAGGSQRTDSGAQQQRVGAWQQSSPLPGTAGETPAQGIRISDMVNAHATNRAGGDERVSLKRPLKRVPDGFTGIIAHGLKNVAGVRFFEEVVVQDPDDPERMYHFSVNDPVHGPCFHLGEGPDGSPLLSWSDIFALYQLPDGSKWAEHGYYNDAEDLEQLGMRLGRDHTAVLPPDMGGQELLRRHGRYHSRLQNIEYECWIYKGKLPESELPCPPDEAFYWRNTFHPYTLEGC